MKKKREKKQREEQQSTNLRKNGSARMKRQQTSEGGERVRLRHCGSTQQQRGVQLVLGYGAFAAPRLQSPHSSHSRRRRRRLLRSPQFITIRLSAPSDHGIARRFCFGGPVLGKRSHAFVLHGLWGRPIVAGVDGAPFDGPIGASSFGLPFGSARRVMA